MSAPTSDRPAGLSEAAYRLLARQALGILQTYEDPHDAIAAAKLVLANGLADSAVSPVSVEAAPGTAEVEVSVEARAVLRGEGKRLIVHTDDRGGLSLTTVDLSATPLPASSDQGETERR